MVDDQPKYPIRTVARRVGLSAFALRAWEKRYGVPRPARTRSRYRYYSDRDVEEITWMLARVRDGIPPRQAARLVRERSRAGLPFVGPAAPAPMDPAVLTSDLKTACLAYDDGRAQDIIQRASAVMPPTTVIRSILLPTVAEIGRDFIAGLVTVAQEHFASQIARRFAQRILDLYRERPGARTVLIGGAPGEQHELGLLALAAEVRSRGERLVYLGPDVPVNALLTAVASQHPAIVFIGIVIDDHLRPLVRARTAVRRVQRKTGALFVWGGPGAGRAVAHGLPGATAATIEGAVQLAGA